MVSVTTSRCRELGHPEFRFQVDGVIEVDVRFFVAALEGWVAEGERFGDGETVQFGWSVLTVRADGDGTHSLLEPDFEQMPMVWVDSVTFTLQHLRLHKDTCESFFEPDSLEIPSMLHACLVCTRLEGAAELVLQRFPPDESDTGWFIGCRAGDHDHNDESQLERVSVYEAFLRNRRLLPYLGLPAGVLLEADGLHVRGLFMDGKELHPRPGSFVEALGKDRR